MQYICLYGFNFNFTTTTNKYKDSFFVLWGLQNGHFHNDKTLINLLQSLYFLYTWYLGEEVKGVQCTGSPVANFMLDFFIKELSFKIFV